MPGTFEELCGRPRFDGQITAHNRSCERTDISGLHQATGEGIPIRIDGEPEQRRASVPPPHQIPAMKSRCPARVPWRPITSYSNPRTATPAITGTHPGIDRNPAEAR